MFQTEMPDIIDLKYLAQAIKKNTYDVWCLHKCMLRSMIPNQMCILDTKLI